MKLEHFRYLLEINRLHSISAAARELYIGQTALSSIVKNVEEELGFPVFQRVPSGVVTTPEGENALALAWEILSTFDDVKQLKKQSNSNSQPVHLLCSPSVSCSLALPLTREFLKQQNAGDLFFHVVTGSEVVNKIMRNEFPIGLTYFTPSEYDSFLIAARKYQIQSKLVYHDHYHVLMRGDHPMAGRRTIALSELSAMEFAMLPHFNINESFLEFIKSLRREARFTTYSNVMLIEQAILEHNILGIVPSFSVIHGCSAENALLKAVELTGVPDSNEIDLCLMCNQRNLRYLEKTLLLCIDQFFAGLDGGCGPDAPDRMRP